MHAAPQKGKVKVEQLKFTQTLQFFKNVNERAAGLNAFIHLKRWDVSRIQWVHRKNGGTFFRNHATCHVWGSRQ